MRWSLRRGTRHADGRAPTAAPSAPVSGAPAAPDPGWRAVPPIASSWSDRTPLTTSPLTPRASLATPAEAPAPPSVSPPQAPPRREPAVEATTEAGARFREALANLHTSGLPRYVSPTE